MTSPAVRVLGVADSDSYLKWAATTLERLAAGCELDPALVVLRSPTEPTAGQVAAAVARSRWQSRPPGAVTLRGLRSLLRTSRPDVVLVATTGPAAELVLRAVATLPYRPVVVTGLPGMSVPATELALRYRTGADLFVVHSHRERAEFEALARRLGSAVRVVVNRLPFLASRTDGAARPAPDDTPLRRVVFAPQAKFPVTADERVELLAALGRLADAQPRLDVVVKLRGLAGDAQTHRERWPFDTLAAQHADLPGVAALRIATGPLDEFLEPGTALVTVSSTAVLEALALGLRALVVGDFGIGEHNLTGVYADSGLVGSLEDLAAGRAFAADGAWLDRNYLQPGPDELPAALLDALAAARGGALGAVATAGRVGSLPSRVRRSLRLALPRASRWGRSAADVLLRR